MNFCILSDGKIIQNIIVAESANVLPGIKLLESYDGAAIGDRYDPPLPPVPPPTEPQLLGQQITDEQLARIELGQRQTDIELSILGGTQHV